MLRSFCRAVEGNQLRASFQVITLRAAAVALVSFSLIAEAGLIRGGGRGARTVIESSQFAGTVPFLIEDPKVDTSAVNVVGAPVATTLSSTDLVNAAAYGYGPSGFAVGASHNWGRDCALTIECVFELEAGESLEWMGHIVGLPPALATGSYAAVADLVVTWSLTAMQAPEPGTFSSGFLPTRNVASWTTRFDADPNGSGNYLSGVGSPAITLGENIAYADAVATGESDPSCFATLPGRPISSLPPTLDIAQAYSFGACREVSLDLSQAAIPLTGSDLGDFLTLPREFLSLQLLVELEAPEGFEFANLIEPGAPFGNAAYDPLAEDLSTPGSIRGLDSDADILYAPCTRSSGCGSASGGSFGMRIDVVGVPIPSTLWLLGLGAGFIAYRRRKLFAE